jgi:hypothetical protein
VQSNPDSEGKPKAGTRRMVHPGQTTGKNPSGTEDRLRKKNLLLGPAERLLARTLCFVTNTNLYFMLIKYLMVNITFR